jgi:plastocyanin
MTMKTKFAFVLLTLALLAACGPKVTPLAPTNTPGLLPMNSVSGSAEPLPTATTQSALSGSVDVSLTGFAFSPAELTIKVGTTVTWTNKDNATHDVKAIDNSWGSGNMAKGDTFSFTFNQAGTYAYKCSFHANMKGTIIVVP